MIRTPLLLAEHVRGLEPKADIHRSPAAPTIVRADPEYDMGITGAMKIAHLAEALGLDVEIHACGPAHRHCMAAMRNTNFYELALVGPGMPQPDAAGLHLRLHRPARGVGDDGCVAGADRPGPGRHLRLGLHPAQPLDTARIS